MVMLLAFVLAGALGLVLNNLRPILIAATVISIIASPIGTIVGIAVGVAIARRRWPP